MLQLELLLRGLVFDDALVLFRFLEKASAVAFVR